MKRIGALHLSIYTVCCALALATACSSGTADPDDAASSSSSVSSSSSGTGGAGSTSASTGTGGSQKPPSVCDNNVHERTADEAFIDDFETDMSFAGWYSFADTDAANFNKIV